MEIQVRGEKKGWDNIEPLDWMVFYKGTWGPMEMVTMFTIKNPAKVFPRWLAQRHTVRVTIQAGDNSFILLLGYGMLISVLKRNQADFDGMYRYFSQWKNRNGLMQ